MRLDILVSAILCAAAIVWAGAAVARAAGRAAPPSGAPAADRALALMQLFAPGVAESAKDPRALLTWVPLAHAARQLFPDAFVLLDQAAGSRFPFTTEQLQAAHARWSSEWLAWERTHDGEYKLKAAAAEADMTTAGNTALAKARLDAVDREKLELYQRRYEEYVRVSKALQKVASER